MGANPLSWANGLQSYLRATPVLLVFCASVGVSSLAVSQLPGPMVHYLLTEDYVTQAELWKRRVVAHLERGAEAFRESKLEVRDATYLSQVPETSDVFRLKLFNATGRIFWSTHTRDIGIQKSDAYFFDQIAKGETYTIRAEKLPNEVEDLETGAQQIAAGHAHIIYEVYVPIFDNGTFVGAIEFYTDATGLNDLTQDRLQIAIGVVGLMLSVLITFSTWIFVKASQHQLRTAQRKSDQERENLQKQMQLAREVKLLGDLNEWLQSSKSLSELFDMVARFLGHLLPESQGSIYVYSNSRDVLDGSAAWNGGHCKSHIHPDSCWGLRRGRTYEFGRHEVNFCCEHLEEDDGRPYYCFPILAHGETVGLMHLRRAEGVRDVEFYKSKKLAQMCAEQISMAIANVRMRDQLQEQSTRDPLTGLFNRRYMLDRLRRLMAAAKAKSEKVHLVYLDVDHFKKFNDTHGHDAGDIVLREVAQAMQEACDGDDIACRMGGEEFMLVWPAITDEKARERAEGLRQKIEALKVLYNEKHLPTITISSGIARYPDDDTDTQALLRHADAALYVAKDGGRNRVVFFADAQKDKSEDGPIRLAAPAKRVGE